MSRRSAEGSLFVGRLHRNTRVRDLEDIFEPYGRLQRCELKYGAEMAYGFIDYEDRRDAEDAIKYENGREIMGGAIIVEWSKGSPRRPAGSFGGGRRGGFNDECYRCNRIGHFARDCPDDRYSSYRRQGSRRYRSPSPRRSRRRSRSRSRSRDRRRRSRSRSRSRDRRSRSRDRRRRSRSRSHSKSKSKRSRSRSRSRSKSGSKGRSPSRSRSRSRSGSPEHANGQDAAPVRSQSHSSSGE